jgi:hypothetical protein
MGTVSHIFAHLSKQIEISHSRLVVMGSFKDIAQAESQTGRWMVTGGWIWKIDIDSSNGVHHYPLSSTPLD